MSLPDQRVHDQDFRRKLKVGDERLGGGFSVGFSVASIFGVGSGLSSLLLIIEYTIPCYLHMYIIAKGSRFDD